MGLNCSSFQPSHCNIHMHLTVLLSNNITAENTLGELSLTFNTSEAGIHSDDH